MTKIRKVEVVPLDEREMARFYKLVGVNAIGIVGKRGPLTVAAGGILLGDDGRVWGFIDFLPSARSRSIYRHARRFLEDRRDDGVKEIYVSRDASIPTSEAFLTRLGFTKTDETLEGKEVWVWRA